jgi:hypothetical protein
MNSPSEVELHVSRANEATMEDFRAAVAGSNPFTDNRVNAPSADAVDVGAIHQQAFDRLTALAVEARDARRGLGAMLVGEAGIGKSQVLSRLVRWANENDRARAVYLHNLQAGPDHLPRSLLKLVVSILTNGQMRLFYGTPLFDLTLAFAHEAMRPRTSGSYPWTVVERAYHNLVDSLSADEPSRAALVDRTAFRVLFHFFKSTWRVERKRRDDGIAALAVRWLCGDALDPDEAKALDLPPGRWRDEPLALADNQQVKQVLVAFSRMALSRNQSFLLLFDQVDNLDDGQAASLSRFLEALIDSAPNLLVVTAGIQASLLHWRQAKIIQDSAWDRLAQFEVALQRIAPAESDRIVAARIARVVAPFSHLEALQRRVRDDSLFPLGRAWRDEFYESRIDVRPREVINAAREGWRRQQEEITRLGVNEWLAGWGNEPVAIPAPAKAPPPTPEEARSAIDRKIAEKIGEHVGRQLATKGALPPDAAHLSGLVAKLLRHCLDSGSPGGLREIKQPSANNGARPPHDLVVKCLSPDGRETTTGIAFAIASHGNESAAILRRLVQAALAPDKQLLVTDERQPLPLGNQGQRYLDELTNRQTPAFLRVDLSVSAIAELDALAAVVGLAQSHDLETDTGGGQARTISPAEVLESLQRQGRYRSAPLLRELLGAA